MYKNNSWFSSKLESCSPLSLYSGLKVELPISATILILTVKTCSFCVQFKGKISVVRNAGFYQSIVARRMNTSNLEPEKLFWINRRNIHMVYAYA